MNEAGSFSRSPLLSGEREYRRCPICLWGGDNDPDARTSMLALQSDARCLCDRTLAYPLQSVQSRQRSWAHLSVPAAR